MLPIFLFRDKSYVRLYRILLRRECKIPGVRRIRLSVGIRMGLPLPLGVSRQQFYMHFHHCHACFMPSLCSLPWLYRRNEMLEKRTNSSTHTAQLSVTVSAQFRSNCCHKQHFSDTLCCSINTRVGNLIVATIYLQLIQNRYMFRSFTVLQCSHQHCVQPRRC